MFQPSGSFPDNPDDYAGGKGLQYPNSLKDSNDSPLMRDNTQTKPLSNRLGKRNFRNRGNQRNFQSRFSVQKNNDSNNTEIGGYRKRQYNGHTSQDTVEKLRKRGRWGNKAPFYRKPNVTSPTSQQHVSAQNRLDRIRNSSSGANQVLRKEVQYSNETNGNISEEEFPQGNIDDDENITVQVINSEAPQVDNVSKFKMVLNPKYQAAIQKIQSRRRDKQVVFPYQLPPHTTQVTMHERFSIL